MRLSTNPGFTTTAPGRGYPHGRTLFEVSADGLNVNWEMVRAGMAEVYRGTPAKGHDVGPYVQAEKEAKSAGLRVWPLGANYRSPREWRRTIGSWTARLSPVYIERIFICPPPSSAVMIMKVMDPITVKMISAGMVALSRNLGVIGYRPAGHGIEHDTYRSGHPAGLLQLDL